jgi:D-alanine transaminase
MSTSTKNLHCYLNGTFLPIDEAKVSVLDRGFMFGDGVYEVIPVYAGKLFRFQQHLARLQQSLLETRIHIISTQAEYLKIARILISKLLPISKNQLFYMQITRGVAQRDHAMPNHTTPTVFAMTTPLKAPSPEQRQHGVKCVSAEDFRWRKGHIKSTSLLGAVFARQMSADVGATETILFRDGYLTEGSSSNVWIVKDNVLLGVPPDQSVLKGIRFDLLEELCQRTETPFLLRPITRAEVFNADAVWLSSATKEILPVTQLDQKVYRHGQASALYTKLYTAYQQAKATQVI